MEWIFLPATYRNGFYNWTDLVKRGANLVGKTKRKGDVLKGERQRGGMASQQSLSPKGNLYGPSAGIKTRNSYAGEK